MRTSKADIVIGIDPDVSKSGVGVVSGNGKEVQVDSMVLDTSISNELKKLRLKLLKR